MGMCAYTAWPSQIPWAYTNIIDLIGLNLINYQRQLAHDPACAKAIGPLLIAIWT